MNERSPFNVSDMILNRLKLRPLLIFDRVLRNQSIARAARELNLTQPAVTKAIRELEQQLDTILFDRNNRGVTPTDCGVLLGERVKSVIAELRYLTDELNTFKGGVTGHVVVGTQISASARLLPRAILLLKERAPKILVTVREGPQDYLFPALATGELDVVVGRLPEPDAPLTARMALSHRDYIATAFAWWPAAAIRWCKKPILTFNTLRHGRGSCRRSTRRPGVWPINSSRSPGCRPLKISWSHCRC